MRKRPIRDAVEPPLTRRDLLLLAGRNVAIAGAVAAVGYHAFDTQPVRKRASPILTLKDFRVEAAAGPRLVVARGEEVARMARAIFTELGGVGRFIRPGDKVLLKPNVGWDRQPEQAANTGPELVAAVVALAREAGAAKVWVSDVSLNDPRRSFARSGIEEAVRRAGGEVILPDGDGFVETDLAGHLLSVWPVARIFHEADRLINLPIAKHHSLCRCTLAMKNWYGALGGRRNQLHQRIDDSIVDLAAAFRPTLTILDATRVLKRNGPTGGSLADVARENTLVGGLDEVAIDAFALSFLDLKPEQVPFLALAEKRGLGRVDWKSGAWKEVS